MSSVDALLNEIFAEVIPPFYEEFAGWARTSRRFRAFASAHRNKIRAKLRPVRDAERLADLRDELLVPALLLRDDRFSLAYETAAKRGSRGPDFSVTFRVNQRFHIEVRRARGFMGGPDAAQQRMIRLAGMLCDKAGQMPAGAPNVLWLACDAGLSVEDVDSAALWLAERSAARDDDFFARYHGRSAAFPAAFARISAVVLQRHDTRALWQHRGARHPLPAELVRALLALPSPGGPASQ
jgi:hypothetical protein